MRPWPAAFPNSSRTFRRRDAGPLLTGRLSHLRVPETAFGKLRAALTPAARSMDKIIEQLGQNSTWRGLILIVGALGWQLSETHNEAIIAAAMALVGLINVFRKG